MSTQAVPEEATSHLNLTASHACLAANRALYIAEILEMILDQLLNDKRSVCRLAFTCKAIAEPALDRLWALNDSLEPFMSLLPKELVLDENSCFQSSAPPSNLPLEKWVTFDKYARRARRLYARTVTMSPHRVYSSIYKQLTEIRPNVELFPNLNTLVVHAKSVPDSHLRMFPTSLRSITFSWANAMAPEVEAVLWMSVMIRLFSDAPLVEHIHFEGSPKEPLQNLSSLPFPQLRKVTIKPSPLSPNVLHKYCHALSASPVQELDLRFVRWPDPRIQPISAVFPSLKKLSFDGSPSHAIEFVRVLSSPVLQELAITSQNERGGDALHLYADLLVLLADKYRGVFRAFKVQHPLQCCEEADLESFLGAARRLSDAGADTLQMNLLLGWKDITREVQDMIDPSKWSTLKHFRISPRRASASWSWTAGNVFFG
ncbi:hypothetical protein JVU11DRAFT_259 [Chiua virens]|nr:hypothetical protein JVU11DRAFT_259 [Chiua virens]